MQKRNNSNFYVSILPPPPKSRQKIKKNTAVGTAVFIGVFMVMRLGNGKFLRLRAESGGYRPHFFSTNSKFFGRGAVISFLPSSGCPNFAPSNSIFSKCRNRCG